MSVDRPSLRSREDVSATGPATSGDVPALATATTADLPAVDGVRTLTDAELAGRWAASRPGAADEVYRRYGTALFETAVGLLDHKVAAADAVQRSFARAGTNVGSLRRPERLRSWLFAILRNEARELARLVPPPVAPGSAAATPASGTAATRATVWQAAAGLDQRDREMFELHLRGGLQAGEIGDVMGMAPQHAAVQLTRLRDRLEQCLDALTLAREGRSACPALYRTLDGWDGRFRPETRARIAQHSESCPICSRRAGATVGDQDLDPTKAPALPAPPLDLGRRVLAGGAPLPAAGWTWRDDGFPYPAEADAELAAASGLPEQLVSSGGAGDWSDPFGGADAAGRRSRRGLVVAFGSVAALVAAVVVVNQIGGNQSAQPVLVGVPSVSAVPTGADASRPASPDASGGASGSVSPGAVDPSALPTATLGAGTGSAAALPTAGAGTNTSTGNGTSSTAGTKPVVVPRPRPVVSRSPKVTRSPSVAGSVRPVPPKPSPSPTPLPPSGITVSPGSLAFGNATTSLKVTVTGYGPSAVDTTASVSGPGYWLESSSARVAAGGSVTYVVRVDRQNVWVGPMNGTLVVKGGKDTVTVPVTGVKDAPPPSPTPTPTKTVASGGPAGYTYCAAENGTCRFIGLRTVAYGANGTFVTRAALTQIACNNATFGDPLVGVGKACYYK